MGRSEFCYNKEIGYLYIPNIFALYPIGNTNQRYAHKSNKQGFRSDYDFTLEKNKSKRCGNCFRLWWCSKSNNLRPFKRKI